MMHYLESLLARATGAPETGRLVMPRPVSLFEPVSGAAWEPPLAGDVGGAGADSYDQPDSNLPGAPITGSAAAGTEDAYTQPDRLTPRVQPHPSTDDTSSSVLNGRTAQDAPTGDDSRPMLSRTPAQDASRGESPPPDVRRAAAPERLAPELQPHPSTGDIALPALRHTPAQDVSTGDASPVGSPAIARDATTADISPRALRRAAASGIQGTPVTRAVPVRAADAHTQSGRSRPELQPHPSTGGSALRTLRPAPAQDAAADGSPARVQGRAGRDSGSDMSPHPPAASVAASQVTASPGAVSSPVASPEAPPVVRVTIGRVDVRAVLPPPVEPPRSQRLAPPAPGPSLSLDDYLKRGRGGA